MYIDSNISSAETDVNMRITKAWTSIDRLSIVKKSNLYDEIKRYLFQAVAMSILLLERTTWTLKTHRAKAIPGSSTPQNSICTATYHLSHKLSE